MLTETPSSNDSTVGPNDPENELKNEPKSDPDLSRTGDPTGPIDGSDSDVSIAWGSGSLEQHRPTLRRYVDAKIDHRMRARVDASDIVQETLIEAAKNAPPDSEEAVLPWLLKIALNKTKSAHRKHILNQGRGVDREQGLGEHDPHDSETPSRLLGSAEQRQQLQIALRELDLKDQELLRQRYFEDKQLKEVAETLGLSYSDAKVRHFRAIKKLLNILKDMSR